MPSLNTFFSSTNIAQTKTLALFVSDIHLSENMPKTSLRFLSFLEEIAINTQKLYLLGDLFEYWAGDDDCDDHYNQQIIQALRKLTIAGVHVYWIAGNRDFLVGETFAQATGIHLLHDPSEICLADQRYLLSHGDALCTEDVNYMQFRAMVRQAAWQHAFLAKPLSERKTIIHGMRQTSATEQKNKSMQIMDVNSDAVSALFQQYPNTIMIHGHTHRNAIHHDSDGLRYVLPDWDYDKTDSCRGGYLQLDLSGKLEFIHL